MRNETAIYMTLITFCLCPIVIVAQTSFTTSTNLSNTWEEIPIGSNVESVGIGDFTNGGGVPKAALHINTYAAYLTPPTSSPAPFNPGRVFRTESPSGSDAMWQMFTGNSTSGEKFNITNPTGTNHVGIGVVQNGNLNFNFGSTPAIYMTIQGTGATNPGYVGIGYTTPNWKLDVNDDINIGRYGGVYDKGYRINEDYVLWHNGDFSNIYVGVQAGEYDGGEENTFVGYKAASGFSLSGERNTCVGAIAGQFVDGNDNTYIGRYAGGSNSTGKENSSLGSGAGSSSQYGDGNVSVGYYAGGNQNTSNYNTSVGYQARVGTNTTTYEYATAIGAYAYAAQSYSIVLGAIYNENGYTGTNIKVGIGTKAPSASLHIDGVNSSFRYRVNNANPTNGHILTTDGSGNATWQAPPTGTLSTCNAPTQNKLAKWCNSGSMIFDNSMIYDNGTRVGINTTSPSSNTKVHVNNNDQPVGTFSYTSTTGNVGIGAYGISQNAAFANFGLVGQAKYPPNFWSVTTTLGFTLTKYSVGVMGQGSGSPVNYGGVFEANQCGSNINNYGVYASATVLRDGKCDAGFAGYFQGRITGMTPVIPVSDSTLKDSIQAITGALSIIEQLHPKSYFFKGSSYPAMNLPIEKQYGLISQQVATVLPDLVVDIMQPQILDTSGTIVQDTITLKALNYTGLIPIAIRGIQELDSLKVGTNATAADSNHVVKWNTTDKTLVNSQIYDNGTHIGIPVTDANSYVNVVNHDRDIAVNVESDYDETSEVIKATYNTDTNPNEVVAVYGYSKYVNGSSQDDGIGGKFTGGKAGVHAIADGDNSIQIGVGGESMNSTSMNVGVLGKAVRYTPSVNVGFSSYVDSADLYNAAFTGESNYINSSSTNAGIVCSAQGSSVQNVGGVFQALDSVGSRTGVYAEAHSLAMGPVAYAGYFDGDVHATGTVTWTSDAQLKQNINPLRPETALEAIMQLQPKTYEYRTADFPHLGLAQGNQYGLLAQEVEQVLPALVKAERHPEIRNIRGEVTSPAYDYKGLNYVGIIPVLIGAVKEQQHKIDSLEEVITDRLTQLEERLNGCCGESNKRDENETPTTAAHQLSVELSSMQVIVLEQNVPNPFAEQTSISYFIPEGSGAAQLIFTDMLGRTIKTMELQNSYGIVTVFASNLSKGQYSYTLVIDGKNIETKRMTKTR